jgi:hypothetical protein
MAFTSRRGRPKKDISEDKADKGTPELQQKRQISLTTETIDWLLTREIITHDQHWCAVHFRWLYTLRYGSPNVQSFNPAHIRGISHQKIYEEWQIEREAEWQAALQLLEHTHSRSAVMNAAVYNVAPKGNLHFIEKGLEALRKQWCVQKTT